MRMVGPNYAPLDKAVLVSEKDKHFFGNRKCVRKRKKLHEQRLDEFAEQLAEGLSPADAAKATGLSPRRGCVLLQELRGRLGWQAQ